MNNWRKLVETSTAHLHGESLQMAYEQGQREGLQTAVWQILTARFSPPNGVHQTLYQIHDLNQLNDLLQIALNVETIDTFDLTLQNHLPHAS